MNEKIRIGLSESIWDEVAEEFLIDVFDCPVCTEDDAAFDGILIGTVSRGSLKEH